MIQEAALALLLMLGCISSSSAQVQHYGKDLGPLSEKEHGVRGRVYAVDSRTLFLKDFHYDGLGPTAYFYVGASKAPSASGAVRLRDERGGTGPLRRYRGESITLSLPEGKTLKDIRWFSIWCDEYAVNFGDVKIPRELEYPRPAKVGALRGIHGVSSDPVVVVDAQTLLIPNFSYDGEAPDAKFWVGRGEKPSPQGIRIPDENGKEVPLRRYDKKTIVLTLPGELTVFDIGHFGVWCEAFTVDFGHVVLPHNQLANIPPSLKMLGVSPQSKLNCEVLYDDLAFEVRWAVAGDSIVLQLVAKLEEGEYMSFGISGDSAHSVMVGGDVCVAWVDKETLKGYAYDYYLDAKSQCAGVRGSCPDERLGEKTNSIRLLNAALVNGYSIVTYQRSLKASDELDKAVLTNTSQPIIWAVGPLNSKNEVSYHSHFLKSDKLIEFGRPPVWNCPMPEGEDERPAEPEEPEPARKQIQPQQHVIKPNPVPTPAPVSSKVTPWEIPPIQCNEPEDGVFYAQMGPTGGKQGYPAITGHVGWGISWYINGLLIPEINVVRGNNYTFVVESGSDPDMPARYHPFYITNDPVGGYYHKSDKEKEGIEIYAGVRRTRSGELLPTGVGRLCIWKHDEDAPEADEYPSFGAYQRSLTLVCEPGNPGVVTWTPDKHTPDTVYYQCFTHRHLGWKINVLDECDVTNAEESQVEESLALPDDDTLLGEESIQVHTRVKPDSIFLDQKKKVAKIINTIPNYNDFSSDKGDANKPQLGYETLVSTQQIQEVIEAVEKLESQMKMQRNNSLIGLPSRKPNNQYEVYEEIKDFMPEEPIREEDEYIVETVKVPESYMLPPNQKPLTLQSVLGPVGGKPSVPGRPFRRPIPPEIKLRRPPPQFQKGHHGYPLVMPNHGPFIKKPPMKHTNNRMQPNMNRPYMTNLQSMSNIPPMKSMPPIYHNNIKPSYMSGPPKQDTKKSNIPLNGPQIVLGTPIGNTAAVPTQSQILNLSHADMIANQVVKSQITLPESNDAIAQSSSPYKFIMNKHDQVILGKPKENPVPLDQQMIQTKHHLYLTPPPPPPQPSEPLRSTTVRMNIDHDKKNIQSSDLIGESTEATTIPPAQNTGFKPETIVIESGFKPIIREPLMAAVDRIADDSHGSKVGSNRREDSDVEDDYEEAPQYINHVYPPSDKITETFEPMFIPSPPDHLLSTDVRTKEVFTRNHAKEDRPHPVYTKESPDGNALFSKKNMDKKVPSDMVMDSDRVSPQYLPPDPKHPKQHSQKNSNGQTFTTYDGKTVSADTLTSIPEAPKSTSKIFSSKLPSNTEILLRKPQLVPFKGEIPPLLAEPVKETTTVAQDSKTTHLKLVNAFHESENKEVVDLKTEASENKPVSRDEKEDENNTQEENNREEKSEDNDDEYYEEDEEEEINEGRRYKRDSELRQED